MFKRLLILIVFVASSTSCTLFQKNISKPVTIKFSDLNFIASVSGPSIGAKYINAASPQAYTGKFLSTFESTAKSTANVTYDNNATNADFILTVKHLRIGESSFTQKINDAKSQYNGQEVMLSQVECSAEVEVFDVKNNKALRACYANRNKAEKVTNNRDLGDLVTGGNKDHTKYHTKLMRDDICEDFASDLGRRIFVHLTKRISKAI